MIEVQIVTIGTDLARLNKAKPVFVVQDHALAEVGEGVAKVLADPLKFRSMRSSVPVRSSDRTRMALDSYLEALDAAGFVYGSWCSSASTTFGLHFTTSAFHGGRHWLNLSTVVLLHNLIKVDAAEAVRIATKENLEWRILCEQVVRALQRVTDQWTLNHQGVAVWEAATAPDVRAGESADEYGARVSALPMAFMRYQPIHNISRTLTMSVGLAGASNLHPVLGYISDL